MTDTPNDPLNASEPEGANGSADRPDTTPEAAAGTNEPQADSATPTPTSESAPPASEAAAQSSDTPESSHAQQASWAAPITAPQPPLDQQAPQQPSSPHVTGTQPTVPQPTVPQPAVSQPAQAPQLSQPGAGYPAPGYATNAFGQPQSQPHAQQQYPQYAGQQPYGTQYATAPGAGAQTAATATKDDKPKRRGVGLVVAALAVGALIGGASGAGVMGIYQANQTASGTPAASTGAANITVNNAADATPVTAVAAKASPSVVTISVTGSQEAGTGSGVVLSADGYVLTNTHVVTLDGEIANPTIQVQDNNGKLYTAKVIGTDPTVDLAVIKLNNASGMTPATFADSSKLNVGDRAVAIGAPLGLAGTVTDGIVSALNRSIQIASSAAPKSDQSQGGDDSGSGGDNLWNFDLPGQGDTQQQSTDSTISLPVIQTDAAINPGNSGGALLNSKGQVIGINVAIASAGSSTDSGSQSGSIGVGFAIPSNLANRVADELKANGKATHGLLGATVKDESSDAKSTTVGATIASVSQGGAAEKAGLKAGDVVTNFNGVPISNPTDLTAQVRFLAAGSKAKLTYVRDGKALTTEVTVGELTQ